MALRMMVYMGLLSQHLIKEGELQDGLLPPIVPIVLYNGTPAWKASQDVADCFGPSLPGLEPFRPRLRYHLVDEARLKLHPMAEVRNLAEALFGVEQSRTLKNTLEIMRALDAMLDDPQMKPLRRTISTWFKLLLRRKVPQANIHELDDIDDILKESTMLEQTIERWFEDATLKGVRQGEQKGRHEGMQQGVQQSYGNFSLTYGNPRAIAALRMRVGSGAMALVKDTRSSKYSQKGIPSLRQVFFRLAKVSRH